MDKPKIIEFQHVVSRSASMNIAASDNLPFKVARVFWIDHVRNDDVRGAHASQTLKKVVVALRGKIDVELTGLDGAVYSFVLKNANQGVYIPPMFWGKITFSDDALLLVLASDNYYESDYIRNYSKFLKMKQQ